MEAVDEDSNGKLSLSEFEAVVDVLSRQTLWLACTQLGMLIICPFAGALLWSSIHSTGWPAALAASLPPTIGGVVGLLPSSLPPSLVSCALMVASKKARAATVERSTVVMARHAPLRKHESNGSYVPVAAPLNGW